MIDLLPDADQQAVIDAVAAYARDRLPVARLRRAEGVAPELREWPALGTLGWIGLGIAEADGGAGLTVVEEALLQREAGRHLVSPALLAGVLGAHAALAGGDAALARAVVHGAVRVGLAASEAAFGTGGTLDGPVWAVEGDGAAWLLLWDFGGVGLVRRDALATWQPARAWDGGVALHRAEAAGLRAAHWVDAASAPLPDRAALLCAAQAAGMAEAVRDMAAAYAKERQQFGKPIGSFQAVAHQCADMAVRAHAAWSQCALAALALRAGTRDAAFQAAAAWLVARDAAERNALANIQVHGGIGYTDECDAHLYLKRIHVLAQLCPAERVFRRRTLGATCEAAA